VDALIEHGHSVTVFDIMKPHRDDVRHIYVDITSLSKTTTALAGGYDVVYLLAAMADVNDVYQNPVEAGEVNVIAVANALEAARRSGVGRLILASTVWVYEAALTDKVDEQTPLLPANIRHVYTATKIAAELYCHAYQRLYGLDFTVLRYGIPYGPRARKGTVLALFTQKALKNEPLTITGDGSQHRNYIYVGDLAEGNVAALKPIARNQTYNLEGPRPITVKEVAETVCELIANVPIEYAAGRPGDFEGKVVSKEKARTELGWVPQVDFREGVRRYYEWIQGQPVL
jgi:UDP-glucose 4-epimerase